jgi:hypothetical protein
MKTTRTLLVLPLAAALLVGCGSSGGGGGSADKSGNNGRPNGGGGVNGISVANCLNDENFLVQPSQTTIDGTSPGGVTFSLIFYASPAAAKTAAGKKNPKTTAIVENAVIDFKGNPSPYAGAPPAKIGPGEIKTIKACMDQNKQ